MAPPPEYDKEPKAPDKSATNISCDETKALHNLANDQQTNLDNKTSSTATSADVENNKLVETLDDGQLRALLDEAITYKCPKDREGKSSLFKELLEEVELDEQASEAAARTITVNRSVNRASGRGSRSRRALPHSNSLQDLVAALAAEPTPRRHHRAPPAPAPAPVSTRAIHGGSLPSGVDTSFLLGEEPARGAGYLATVRCVNPPPLAERRVSTDASCNELDSLNRRSKPAFPMTYTARATLEIGSGAVSSGRAVTTTTASNQVRTMPPRRYHHYQPRFAPPLNHPTAGPPERLYPQKRLYYPTKFKKPKRIWLSGYDDSNAFNKTDHNNERNVKSTPCDKEIGTVDENTDRTELTKPINVTNTEINVIREETAESSSDNDSDTKLEHIVEDNIDSNQFKLLSALIPKMSCDKDKNKGGGRNTRKNNSNKEKKPRGPHTEVTTKCQQDLNIKATIPAGVHTTSIVTSVTIPDLQKIDKNKISPTSSKKILNREENPGKGTKISKKEERKNSINPTIGAKNIKGVTTTKNKSEPTASITSKEATVSKIKDLSTLAAEQHNAHNLVSDINNEWEKNIINWYGGLKNYCLDSYYKEEYYPSRPTLLEGTQPRKQLEKTAVLSRQHQKQANKNIGNSKNPKSGSSYTSSNILHKNIAPGEDTYNWTKFYPTQAALSFPLKRASHMKEKVKNDSKYNVAIVQKRENMTVSALPYTRKYQNDENMRWVLNTHNDPPPVCESFGTDYFRDNYNDDYLDRSRREYQERIGKYLVVPKIEDTINPRNVRNMTIGKPLSSFNEFDIPKEIDFVTEPKNNECIEENKLSKESSQTDDNDDQYVLSFEELAISSSKDFAFDRENNKEHQSVGANSSSVSALSFGLDNMHENLEIFHDSQDVPVNVSVRSNTPEQKYIKFKTNDIIIDQDNEGFSTKNNSQKEDTSVEKNTVAASAKCSVLKEATFIKSDMKPASSEKSPNLEGTSIEIVAETYSPESSAYIAETSVEKCTEVASSTNSSNMEDTHGNYKLKKGTVIPLIYRPDSVSTDDNNEHLCSSSKEKEPPSEKEKVNQPPQQAQTYTESINVNPIRSYDMLDQEKHVELVDMSSQTQNREDQIQDNLKEFINYEKFSDDLEDIPLSKTFEDTQTILKSDAAYKTEFELVEMSINSHKTEDLNLENVKEIQFLDSSNKHEECSFSKYLADQQRLFQSLEDNNLVVRAQKHSLVSNISSLRSSEKVPTSVNDKLFKCDDNNIEENKEKRQELVPTLNISDLAANYKVLVIKKNDQGQLVLTMPEININDSNIKQSNAKAIEYNCEEKSNNTLHCLLDQKLTGNNLKIEKSKLKKKKSSVLEKTKLETANKKALKAIMFENPSESSRHKSEMSTPTVSIEEVDSAIPFSCITTPEVVASCNTTSSTQSAVAVDPKPLQLASSYRAVTSLVGEPPPRAASPPPALASASALSPQRAAHLLAPLTGSGRPTDQPRGVVTSSFNGLPLSRPNYGSTGNTSQDEYKKSIDENGNSVQGFSSPLSGSSQHKKPRRKKSSKNETVIKSHQIDGYQGNKDLNEVLRFIESAADNQRAGKLGRAKHREDGDDKGGKKRKNKESKMKRATSMEELSLSRMEDLTDKPSPPARAPRHSDQAKAERRSWGDDARDATTRFFREEPIDAPVVPDTEFQTVTKKRKPRRHQHESHESHEHSEQHEPAGGDPPRANRPPEPRARRVSAPPSDRSNDSNDDMDSVHSLPADSVVRSTVPAPISYADIARTRHNIPDLIESCNYYSEPERERSDRDRGAPPSEPPLAPLPVPGLADGYPALEPRRRSQPAAKPQHAPATTRPGRKVDRTESVRSSEMTVTSCAVEEWPAPDVVADRRPAVILLDSAAQARDMDGVTFGFDINETLLGDPPRRARCDLLRDALEGATPPDSNGAPPSGGGGGGAGGVAVGGACGALRYVPPAPPLDTLHLHQIIDYVGAAWEDVLRLGKVRYYSE